jgi:hypothetical protein
LATPRNRISRGTRLVSLGDIGHIEVADRSCYRNCTSSRGGSSGKPAERRGRKATGLKRGAMTAGLPAEVDVCRRTQGETRPGMARAATRLHCLPARTGFCRHAERTA